MPKVEGVNGISGRDKICTLHPYKIVSIVPEEPEEPQEPTQPIEEEPVNDGMPQLPENKTNHNLIDWLIAVLQWVKTKL